MTQGKDIDLLAVGLTTLDITAHAVSGMPPAGNTQLVGKIALSPAGTACGAALIAQRLGLRCALSSAIGGDPQGAIIRQMLAQAGINTTLLATDPNHPTSTTILPVSTDGERPNWHMLGASAFCGLTKEDFAILARCRAVHFAAVGFPAYRAGAARFLQAARAAGALVTCDLISPSDATKAHLRELLPYIDIFMPSRAEFEFLAGAADIDAAAAHFLAAGAGACLFKLGRNGAAYIAPGMRLTTPAFDITPVDTTSCGDAVCAGYHAALHHGMPPENAVTLAQATAALVACGVGTTGILENFAQVAAFANSAKHRQHAA